MFKQYGGVRNVVLRYWKVYGGWSGLWGSPYFHVAILFSLFFYPYWQGAKWWESSLSILPNIIGFSLGGYAIWLGFGDERFQSFIAKKKNGRPSSYMAVSATFAHFIVVQIIALLMALIANATAYDLDANSFLANILFAVGLQRNFVAVFLAPVGYFFGYLVFIYAITTALAATFAVFRIASWFERHQNMPEARPRFRPQRPRAMAKMFVQSQKGLRAGKRIY